MQPKLIDVCKHYNGLEHQNIALEYLQGAIPHGQLNKFAELWRQTPDPAPETQSVAIPANAKKSLPSRAKFVMDLKKQSALVMGEFYLIDGYGKQMRAYAATSGAPGWQGPGDIWVKGKGPCPPLPNLKIDCSARWSPHVRGVEGWFFNVLPWTMHGPNGAQRGSIGIHRDANVPGSAGCQVFENDKEFNDDFVPLMGEVFLAGVKEIPLEVVYK